MSLLLAYPFFIGVRPGFRVKVSLDLSVEDALQIMVRSRGLRSVTRHRAVKSGLVVISEKANIIRCRS